MGTTNGAYSFDGASDYIQTTNPGPTGTGAMSVALWFKTTNTASGSSNTTIAWGRGTGSGTYIYLDVENGVIWGRFNGDSVHGGSGYNDGNWHYLVITWPANGQASTMKVYVDGQAITLSASGSDVINLQSSLISIGAGLGLVTDPPHLFKGSLADVRIYNRALSAGDITNLYNSYNSQVNLYSPSGSGGSVNLTAGLIGYWPFNGNAKDATPYQHDGTVNGATLTTGRSGQPNTAYSFDGVSNYIQMSPGTSFSFPNTTFSVSLWEKLGAGPSSNYIGWSGDNFCYGWGVLGNGNFWLKGADAGSNCTQDVYNTSTHGQSIVKNGAWHNLTYVVTTNTTNAAAQSVQLYIDGVADGGTFSGDGTYSPGTNSLFFGERPSAGSNWGGSLEDIRIYNRALNAAEIQALYNLSN
ncbi:MAG TPA: LamG domain-containing protein [Candidatus Saccharimonadales bacterium]|nr:LamG domain-containing protein [Candidatus Saccharimonadales bacterium]